MSNKNLLNENTVRRFMKLAEIEPLTDQFVGKLNESDDLEEGQRTKKQRLEEEEADLEERNGAPKKADDKKVEEAMHDKKADEKVEEAMYSMADDDDKKADEGLDEEINALLAELEMVDDDEDDEPLDDDEDDEPLDDAPPLDPEEDAVAAEPMDAAMPMDPAALKDTIKDAVMEALEELVADGKINVDDEGVEPVDVDPKVDMMGEKPMVEEDEAMVNEVARRVMKRIVNARK